MFNASIIYFVILFASQASYFSSYSYTLPYFFFLPPCSSFHRKKKKNIYIYIPSDSRRAPERDEEERFVSIINIVSHLQASARASSSACLASFSPPCVWKTRRTTSDDRERVSFPAGTTEFLRFRDILFTFFV